MTIQNWSDDIIVAELADDPQFADEMAALAEMLSGKSANVVLNMQAVTFLNSSNISRLLRLRKQMLSAARRLIICGIGDQVGGVFAVTGLDKIFEFTNDVATALAKTQLGEGQRAPK
jgi:anti-anti-sigma factor